MGAARATYVAIFLVCGASSRSFAERRETSRSARMLTTLRSEVTPTGAQDGRGDAHLQAMPRVGEQARPAIDPASASALGPHVLGARLTLAPTSVIERAPTWFELPEPAVRKRFRMPKVIAYPTAFAMGGVGLKLKLRF